MLFFFYADIFALSFVEAGIVSPCCCSLTTKSHFARFEPCILCSSHSSGEPTCNFTFPESILQTVTHVLKQEALIYFGNSSFGEKKRRCLKSSTSVPCLLLISQRKEFCSAAQTFLCLFLRRSLTMALTVAPSEMELRRVAIPFCFHKSLVLLKVDTVAACISLLFFFGKNHL